jgi:Flp pilus assembly protein TadG
MTTAPTQPPSDHPTDGTERGTVAVASMILALSVIAAAGLAIDGGRKLNALAEARDLADNAARVGAQQVDVDAYRASGTPTLDPGEASAAASAYLATTGNSGSVAVTGDEITVTVTLTVNPRLLPGTMTVTATESANAESGVTDSP